MAVMSIVAGRNDENPDQERRVIDPASNFDEICDLALAAGRVVGIGSIPSGFAASKVIDASGCLVVPGLVDLAARLREPGHEHEGMLESEMALRWPAVSPAWCASPTPIRCWTNPAWWRC